ncbi:formyltransferase family protein [Streptomyces sp. NBC_01716]|uniref:formyltransferase family protein n=1 Tax=Streptomyces sp. NBC_01716 TaxID=2975917 RepID=UPI002E362FA3|nr:formyltransferase family protein [Streptomyces sp. NBC_01716]
MSPYFLLTENTLHAAYLVTDWLAEFGTKESFHGVVLRDDPLPKAVRIARDNFHRTYQGERSLDEGAWERLYQLYPDLSETERTMIRDFGVPRHTVTQDPDTVFLGRNLNSEAARKWLDTQCAGPSRPFLFVFLDRILAPWWIEMTESRIINAHSAVLPHARGTFAIEQTALLQDPTLFRAAAGATAHFVDTGVDTGPVVRAVTFTDPFTFESIWSCKGHSFMLAFNVLRAVAHDMTEGRDTTYAGVVPAPSPHGSPEFRRDAFTPERQAASEAAYAAMRAAAQKSAPSGARKNPIGSS